MPLSKGNTWASPSTCILAINRCELELTSFSKTQSFCTDNGAQVNGKQTGKAYLDLTGQKETDANIKVYIKMRRLADDSSGVADIVKKHLEDKLDLKPSDPPELREAKLKQLKSIYDANDWKAMTGTGKVV